STHSVAIPAIEVEIGDPAILGGSAGERTAVTAPVTIAAAIPIIGVVAVAAVIAIVAIIPIVAVVAIITTVAVGTKAAALDHAVDAQPVIAAPVDVGDPHPAAITLGEAGAGVDCIVAAAAIAGAIAGAVAVLGRSRSRQGDTSER